MSQRSRPVELFLLATLSVSVTACASGPGRRGGPPGAGMGGGAGGGSRIVGPIARPAALMFAGMDTDRDIVVSRNEVEAMTGVEWNRLSGGRPTASTLVLSGWLERALGSPDAQPLPVAFDNNFDGLITREEFETRIFAEFDLLDKSKDGRLSRDEMLFEQPVSGSRGGVREVGPQGADMPPRGGPGR